MLIIFNTWFPSRQIIIRIASILILSIILFFNFLASFAKSHLPYLYEGLNAVIKNFSSFSFNIFMNSSGSMSLRYKQILFAIEHQDKIPLIGVGIGKAILVPESFYALYFYRTGIIGIVMHFAIILYSIYWALYFSKTYTRLNAENNFMVTTIFYAIAIYFISFFIDYLSSAVNDQTRTGFVFYSLIAILSYYKKHYRKMIY
jgi:hypothetical protein